MSNKQSPTYSDWRNLSPNLRLQVLANFYPSLSKLSEATGISVNSLRSTLHNLAAGKNVKVTASDKYKTAMARARHRMTDAARRIEKKYKAGEYEAPVIRYSGGVIVPTRPGVFLGYANKEVKSFWVHYRVEHLPYEDQREIARILFDWSMQTGQFNDFRFEYLSRADYYRETASTPRRTWKDRNLQEQADVTNYVRLSTTHTPLLEIAPDENSDRFLDYVDDSRRELIPRGLVQIVDWCFSWRREYAEWKPLKPAAKKKNKKQVNKRGK